MSDISIQPEAEELQIRLRELAQKIVSDLSELDPACGKELLSDFVSELFLSAAEQSRQRERRQRQAEGIAAAKARGVRFGRPTPPLPEEFESLRQAWREGKMTLREAARACNMPSSTFYGAALRQEQAADRAG